ncbi:MAG: serine/threonine protein kinase [Deltaproteobacteria bacterium]|nr:serine/threonine protein kinase [Deltaproteobacteria bacterium]
MQERFCPRCDVDLDLPRCPADGVVTLRLVPAEHCVRLGAGDKVGGFTLLRQLGAGGHGAVWAARPASGIGEVAVKVLHPDGADRDALRRFFREAEIGARLRHPSTVRVFEAGQHAGGAVWLAMELLHGHTLEAELGRLADVGGVLGPDRAVALFGGVLAALAEAHALGVIHRDVKTRNLMLVGEGGEERLKLLDFGVARLVDLTMTDAGKVIGTAATMSPEQCRGEEVDARSDLYAVGVVLFRSLAGRWPFGGADPLTTMYGHVNAPAPDLQVAALQPISPELAAVVMRSLAKDPAARFAGAEAMRSALESANLASGQSPSTVKNLRAPRPETPRFGARRRRAWAWATVGAAVATAAVATFGPSEPDAASGGGVQSLAEPHATTARRAAPSVPAVPTPAVAAPVAAAVAAPVAAAVAAPVAAPVAAAARAPEPRHAPPSKRRRLARNLQSREANERAGGAAAEPLPSAALRAASPTPTAPKLPSEATKATATEVIEMELPDD